MSEQILLLNPRRKRRSRKGRMPAGLARYWASKRRRVTNPRRRRRHARRRVARTYHKRRRVRMMPVLTNRRRRRSHRRHARRRHLANPRRARRFSGGGGTSIRGMIKGYVVPGVIGGVGTLALDVVYGYVSPHLPANLQAGWFGVAAKLGVILGTGYALNRFAPRLRSKTQVAVLGATTVLAYGAIKQAVAGMLPAGTTIPGLSGYGQLGAYVQDFQRMPVRGMGAYMPARTLGDYYSPAAVIGAGPAQAFNGLGRLGAYMGSQPHTGGVAGFDYMNDGM